MQLFDRMCMALGGRAAEAKIFKRVTTGIRSYFMITAFWRFVFVCVAQNLSLCRS